MFYVNMILCHDVVSIVVKYLDYSCLWGFFLRNGLSLDMGFRYGYGVIDESANFNEMMVNFPNMVLEGVGLSNCGDLGLDLGLRKRLKNVSYCRVYYDASCWGFDSDLWREVKVIDEIVNVRVLDIINCHLNGICKMDNLLCVNVECLIFGRNEDVGSPNLQGISQWLKLKKIVLNDRILVNDEDFYELSLCPSLRYLDMDVMILDGTIWLNCSELRVLKMRNYRGQDLRIVRGCCSLEKLVIENCSNLSDLSMLWKECPRLRCLMIRGPCDNLQLGEIGKMVKIVEIL